MKIILGVNNTYRLGKVIPEYHVVQGDMPFEKFEKMQSEFDRGASDGVRGVKEPPEDVTYEEESLAYWLGYYLAVGNTTAN